jgi:hypothetical protein
MITPENDINQSAFWRLKPLIDQTYPPGHFVAIDEGQIIADAASFEELDTKLDSMGKTSPQVLVVQAGEDYPDFGWILTAGTSS